MCSVRYRHADVGRARLLPADRGAAGPVRELLGVDLATVRAAAANAVTHALGEIDEPPRNG